ncbi:MAG: hypothetical protein GX589_08795 [Deltaproteobacteria bacterium]|nr:hypothetical protein [Deltaproteobacteria bacterium]
MKKIGLLGGVASSVLWSISLANAQVAQPTATLTFKTTPKGRFSAKLNYDRLPKKKCVARLLARSEAGGVIGDVVEIARRKELKKENSFRRRNLPRVEKAGGTYPVVHMLVRTKCGGEVIDSNVFARRIRCGQDRKVTGLKRGRVAISRWLKILKSKFKKK